MATSIFITTLFFSEQLSRRRNFFVYAGVYFFKNLFHNYLEFFYQSVQFLFLILFLHTHLNYVLISCFVMSRKTIIFDTNFLLIPGIFHVDIFSEAERLIPSATFAIIDKTLNELDGIIATQRGKDVRAAILAKSLIKAKALKIIQTDKQSSVDDLTLRYSDQNSVVGTQDLELRKKLINKGITVLVLRNKTHLAQIIT